MLDIPDFLNPDLASRVDDIRDTFLESGKVAIPNYLRSDLADAIYHSLDKEVPWFLETEVGSPPPKQYPFEEYSLLSDKAKLRLVPKSKPYRGEFNYAFERFDLTPETYEKNEVGLEPLKTVYFGFHSQVYRQLIKQITAFECEVDVSSQFSKYAAGHFAGLHFDKGAPGEKKRLAAHVLALTPNWDKNWGGHFCFCDSKGKVLQRKMPSFNTLNIFTLPRFHSVQPVKTFSKQSRYSVFGWINDMTPV